jgi:hypothetical protein
MAGLASPGFRPLGGDGGLGIAALHAAEDLLLLFVRVAAAAL